MSPARHGSQTTQRAIPARAARRLWPARRPRRPSRPRRARRGRRGPQQELGRRASTLWTRRGRTWRRSARRRVGDRRREQRVSGLAEVPVERRGQRLAVDRSGHGHPHGAVGERAVRVEREHHGGVRLADQELDAVGGLQLLGLNRGDRRQVRAAEQVDLARAQRRHPRLGVGDHLEFDPVDARLLTPVPS